LSTHPTGVTFADFGQT